MPDRIQRSSVPQIPDEVFLRELGLIETSYGQLVYLASLRNPDTGKYEHYGSGSKIERAQAGRLLKRKHEEIFRAWLTFSLRKKMTDIVSYIDSLDDINRPELIDAWLRLTPYKNLVPAAIQGPEREKHVSDFEAILGLLKNVYGVASPNLSA